MGIVPVALAATLVAIASCGGSQDVRVPMHLARVVLYANGLAHFERSGTIDDDHIDLQVPPAHVDDVVRSLTVVSETTHDDSGRDDERAPPPRLTGIRMLPSEGEEDVTLRVGLAGAAGENLRLTYVTELPGFRPTYRVVVNDEDVHLQGLAVVDNPTSEAWEDVLLTLSTEVPLSFRFDVRTAPVAHRPQFGPGGRLLNPAANPAMDAVPNLLQNPLGNPLANPDNNINRAYGLAQRGQPRFSTRAGELVENPAAEAPPTPGGAAGADPAGAMLAFEHNEAATGGGVFRSVHGFDLGRGESGLVPFVDTNTRGERALVFKPSVGGPLSAVHPYRAVLFENPSEAPLITGPVTIYADERYVGDGVTGSVAGGAHAFVPYALERSVTVATDMTQEERAGVVRSVLGGIATLAVRRVQKTRFTVEVSAAARDAGLPLYLYVANRDGYQHTELPTGAVRGSRGVFLPVPTPEEAGPHAAATLTLEHTQTRRQEIRVNLASSPRHVHVGALLRRLEGEPSQARLRDIVQRLEDIEREDTTLQRDITAERGALSERREALDALRGVPSAGAVRRQVAAAVATGVARLGGLTGEGSALRAERIGLEQEWYGLLRVMRVSHAPAEEGQPNPQ